MTQNKPTAPDFSAGSFKAIGSFTFRGESLSVGPVCDCYSNSANTSISEGASEKTRMSEPCKKNAPFRVRCVDLGLRNGFGVPTCFSGSEKRY